MAKVQRTAGDKWSIRLSLTDPLTGRRIQRRVSARTKRLLDAEVARIRAEWHSGSWIEPDKTLVADWLTTWHSTYKAAPASRYKRGVHIRKHIAASDLGGIPLVRLRYTHCQDWVDGKVADGLAANTIRSMVTTLNMALAQAVRRQLIPSNPCTGLDLPGGASKRWVVLDETQARRLISDTRDDPFHALYVLAVTLGLRRGELLALRWADIDLAAGTLRVERTATVDEDNRRTIGDDAKTDASRRTIRLPAVCGDALRRQRARQNERRLAAGDIWRDTGAVFDSGLGEPWEESAIFRSFKAVKTTLGLPSAMRFHDLRHTAASHMLRAGVPVVTVSEILGHANAGVTLRLYSHIVEGMMQDAADLIDRLYGEG